MNLTIYQIRTTNDNKYRYTREAILPIMRKGMFRHIGGCEEGIEEYKEENGYVRFLLPLFRLSYLAYIPPHIQEIKSNKDNEKEEYSHPYGIRRNPLRFHNGVGPFNTFTSHV